VHEDDLNAFLDAYGHLTGMEFVNAYTAHFKQQVNCIGAEQVPNNKRYIFAANHPIGSHDGAIFVKTVYDNFGPNKALINDLLMNVKPLVPLVVGVNKHGGTGRDSVKSIDEAFNSDYHIIMFPSGLVSRMVNGKIADLDWKKTVITRAIRHNREIVPVYISGRNTDFFYRFAQIREAIGIKFNLEMLYLVDELYNKIGNTMDLVFGKPIPPERFDKSQSPTQWAAKLRKHVYKIADDPSAIF
jgi:putative hemolysin